MSFRAFQNITISDLWNRETAAILQWTRKGKLNNVGEVTLSAGTETTITDALIGPDSAVALIAKSGGAKDIRWSADSYAIGSVVITHDAAAGTEVFRYTVTG